MLLVKAWVLGFVLLLAAAPARAQPPTAVPFFPDSAKSQIALPTIIREVRPRYTEDARKAKIEGSVSLECVVEPDGTVGDVRIVSSLDKEHGLDDEAVKAARQWRFNPGRRDGKPARTIVALELFFHLDSPRHQPATAGRMLQTSGQTPPPPPPGATQHTVSLNAGDPPRPPGIASSRAVILIPLGQEAAVPLTAPAEGVDFDIDGDGHKERVAWTQAGANVAFLFYDTDRDGILKNGKQLIGGSTTGEAWNGFMALRILAPGAGAIITEAHPLFSRLLLGVDRNHDGRSDPAELRPIGTAFQQIGLGYFSPKRVSGEDAHGNVFRFEGWLQRVGIPADAPVGYSPIFDVVLRVAR